MKKQTKIIVICLIILTIIGLCGYNNKSLIESFSNNKQLTMEQKLNDFDYMYKILKENYPYFEVNKRLNGVDWLSRKDKFIDEIKATKDDESYFKVLQSILSELNNGHASIFNKDIYSYMENCYEHINIQSEAWLKQLNNSVSKERYSKMPASKSKSQVSNYITHNNIKTSILEKDKIAYMAIHSFNTNNISGDMKIINPFLQSIMNYKSLIIDIRGNGGGDTRYWTDNIVPMLINKPVNDTNYLVFRGGSFCEQFIKNRFGVGYSGLCKISELDNKKLKNIPPEVSRDFKYYFISSASYRPINSAEFNGKIYLLIDGSVFSSAEAFAIFAKDTGFAVLVGEKTGGDGIGIDPAVCALPNSGYVFRFPQEMGLISDGTCNFEHKTEPDIKVSAKVGSDFSNDEAIKAILKVTD